MALAAGALSTGCKATEPDSLRASPADIAWGEIDFQQEMPASGYDEQIIDLTNDAEEDVTVEILELDLDHLCSPGIPSTPFEVGSLTPGQMLGVFVSLTPVISIYAFKTGRPPPPLPPAPRTPAGDGPSLQNRYESAKNRPEFSLRFREIEFLQGS